MDMKDDLFFKEVVHSYTQNPRFLRREWLAAEVDSFLKEPDCRFLLLTAEPGAGKSTFLAQLASDRPSCLVYFIRHDQRATSADVGAHSFLLRIGYQLAALHPQVFGKELVQLTVEQRVGTVGPGGTVVAAEVERILASPFYQQVVEIRQQVELNHGSVAGLRIGEWVIEPRLLPLSDLQNMALIDPARALLEGQPDQQIIILVDALDELQNQDMITADLPDELHNQYTEKTLLSWLTNCPKLPPNLRFILTSRPSKITLRTLREKQARYMRGLTIEPEDKRVQDDLDSYVKTLVSKKEVSKALGKRTDGIEGFKARAVQKAEGNLGYLDALARAIDQSLALKDDQSLRQILELQELPDHLEGLYAFFLHQIKSSVQRQSVELEDPETGKTRHEWTWPAVYMRILGVLAVAREPLSFSQIRDLGNISAEGPFITEAIERLAQFLNRLDDRYRLYHATVAEFLTAARTSEHGDFADLYIDASRWHKRVATHYWTSYHDNWRDCDSYGLKYLAMHLFSSADDARLQSLISKEWMQVRYEQNGFVYTGFMADVELAWRLALAHGDPDRVTLTRLQAVRQVVGQRISVYTDSDLEVLVRLGRTAEALAHTRLRPHSKTRFDGALVVYNTLAALGKPNPELLHEVQQIAAAISDPQEQFHVLMKLARVDSRSAADSIISFKLAAHIAVSIESEDIRAAALKTLFYSAKEHCGELYDVLIESIETIGNINHRADLLTVLADTLPSSNDPQGSTLISHACALIESLPDAEARSEKLRRLGEVMARRGIPGVEKVWQAALLTCRQIDPADRGFELSMLARVMAPGNGSWASEIFSEALLTVRKIRKKLARIRALADLSHEMFLAKDPAIQDVLDEARALSLTFMDRNYRDQGLEIVAEKLVEGGRLAEACEMAMLIAPDERRSTLNSVLRGLVAEQRYEESIALLSLMNTSGRITSDIELALDRVRALFASGGSRTAQAADRLRQAAKKVVHIDESGRPAVISPRKVEALNSVSQILSKVPETQNVAETSESLPLNGSAALITALVQANDPRALSVLALIQNREDREEANTEASKALSRLGQFAKARELILANSPADPNAGIERAANRFGAVFFGAWADPRVEGQEILTRALVQAGRESEALNDARNWADAGQRDSLLRALSDALADAGKFAHAWEVARETSFVSNRILALRSLAGKMAMADAKQANEVFQEALDLSNSASDPEKRSATLLSLAGALARRGYDTAKQIFQQSRETEISGARESRGSSMHDLERMLLADAADFETMAQYSRTNALAKAGYFEMAEEAAREINHSGLREGARSVIASQLVSSGRAQEGLKTANDLSIPRARLGALLSVAEQLDLQGNELALELFHDAYQQISAVEDESSEDRQSPARRAIEVLTNALVRAELFDDASRFAKAVPDDELCGKLLAEVGAGLVSAGRLDEAETLMDSLTNDEIAKRVRDKVNAALASIEMRRGRRGEADALLKQIQDQDSKDRCAQSIAAVCIESGRFVEALNRLDEPGVESFIGMLARQADSLDRWRPGLALTTISAATEVASWTDPMWRETHNIILAASKSELMPQVDASAADGVPGKLWIVALFWLCEKAAGQGDYDEVCRLLARIRIGVNQPSELRRAAKLACSVGSRAMKEGDPESAALVLREGLQIAQDEGPIDGVAIFLGLLAQVESTLGKLIESQTLAEEALALWEQNGNPDGILESLCSLGLISESMKDGSAARAYYQRALTLSEERGNAARVAALRMQLSGLDRIDKPTRKSSGKGKSGIKGKNRGKR